MSALDDIAAACERQRVREFGPGRADDFVHHQLARAAASCAEFAAETEERRATIVGGPRLWPWWALGPWEPGADRRADLVRAGAFIVAEIERLDRLAARAA